MRRIRAFLLRLGGLSRKGQQDRHLGEEIESHLQLHIDDNLRAGMSPEEARRQAMLRLGGVDQTVEAYRDQRGFPLLDSVLQDLRYGFRVLRRNPGFAMVAMFTLALCIGANTAIFSLVNVVMLRLLPVQHPEQLVELLQKYPGYPRGSLGWSSQSYENLRDNNHAFSELTGTSFDNIARVRTEDSEPEVVVCEFVVGNFFPTLGVKPAIGRLIGSNDTFDKVAVGVAVVSWSYWNSRFHLDPAVLGKQIVVNGQPMVIIGVAARGFWGIRAESRTDVWVPRERTDGISHLLGRLRPDVSIKQVRAEMFVLYQSTLEEIAKTNKDPLVRQRTIEVEPAGTGLARIRDYYAKPLIALTAIVGLLLIIGCSNLASLLLARAVARQREMAVRVSLGAGRGRLIRQVLTESWLLSLMGTLFGIVFAYVSTGVLVRIIGSGREHERFALHVQPDLHLLIFTVAATLVTGLLFGMPTALQSFRTGRASAMRQAGAISETKGSRLFGKSLVASQVAFSIVLLTAATLFVGNLWHLENLDLGFSHGHVLLLSLDPEQGGYKPEQLPRLYQDLLSRLQAIPGVLSASISGVTPIQGAGFGGHFVSAEGYQERPEDRRRGFLEPGCSQVLRNFANTLPCRARF
jgi:predicted permease